jgi:hypothetical protein
VAAGCGHAEAPPPASGAASSGSAVAGGSAPAATPAGLDATEALCRPVDTGEIHARLRGAVDAEIDWTPPATPQCLGGPRPTGDGLRLVYKGRAGADPLLLIVGIAIGEDARSARNVGASVTIVREGAGQFFATQGDDKCAMDTVTQEPLPAADGRYRLSGRGYCTQPARAVGTDGGAVLVSRFDVAAVVEYPGEH